ncbi:MAG: hypothetical protein ACRDV0_03005 [Acidimicrobiales bacterium]
MSLVAVAASVLVVSGAASAAHNDEDFYLVFGPPAVGSNGSYSASVTTPSSFAVPSVSLGGPGASGQSVSPTFSITGGNSAGCSIGASGSSFTYSHAGTCVVTAVASGNLDNDTDVDTATGTLSVTVKSGTQTIAVTPQSGPVGTPLPLAATGFSGTGAITFALTGASTALGCALSGSYPTASVLSTGSGTCVVTATIAADANFAQATSSPTAITFTRLSQTISVSGPVGTVGQPVALTVSGYSGKGLITLALVGGGTATGCSLSGDSVDATGPGTCNVTASIAQDPVYLAATSGPVPVSFVSNEKHSTLTVTASSETVALGTAVSETGAVSGLFPGDSGQITSITFTYSGSGTTTYGPSTSAPSAAGTYSVTPSNAFVAVTPNADSVFYGPGNSYNDGLLTIVGAHLTVTAAGSTIVAGQSFVPSASVSGAGTGDAATLNSASFVFAGIGGTNYGPSSVAPSAVGAYSVTPSDASVIVTPSADQSDYPTPYTYVAGTLIVSPAPIVIPVNAPKPPAPPPPRTMTVKPFTEGSYALGKKLRTQVLAIANAVKHGHYHAVLLTAYTDNVFTAAFNLVLNQNRAQAVRALLAIDLAGLHVSGVTITIVASPTIVLVATNTTAKGRAANRRVVAILKAG